MVDYGKNAVELHEKHQGKLAVFSKVNVKSKEDLSLAYTPGVAQVCLEIEKDQQKARTLTLKGRTVAVVTDGSAVLGLGNIGAHAAMPVMEGKAVLFKEFADVDAFPICLDTQDTDEIIKIVKNIAPTFGGINLEDISAPRCFEIEARLSQELDIPVFHDDQHGTAVVTLAAVINAFRLLKKDLSTVKTVINGAGAAGTAIAKLLVMAGVEQIVMLDSKGVIYEGRPDLKDEENSKRKILEIIGNRDDLSYPGSCLKDALKGADLFIGVSAPNVVTKEMIQTMSESSVVFAMSNPTPEIMPDLALAGGAKIVGTGRSDFPNQINNVLVFPGIFKGAFDSGAKKITDEMKFKAAKAIASFIGDDQLNSEYIIPGPFEDGVSQKVAKAVSSCV